MKRRLLSVIVLASFLVAGLAHAFGSSPTLERVITKTRRYITEGTNVQHGVATLAQGGSTASLKWASSYSGRRIDLSWGGASQFLLRVHHHPYPDSAKIDSMYIQPYYNGPSLYYEDADSVFADPPGSGTASLWMKVAVE